MIAASTNFNPFNAIISQVPINKHQAHNNNFRSTHIVSRNNEFSQVHWNGNICGQKQELFNFLVAACITIECQCTVVSTIGNLAIKNWNYELLYIAPSNQEEYNIRMLLRAKDSTPWDIKKGLIWAVNTDVVVISIHVFEKLDLLEVWLAIGTDSHLLKYNQSHHLLILKK